MNNYFQLFGNIMFHYSGEGQVHLSDNSSLDCKFESIQTTSGQIVVNCVTLSGDIDLTVKLNSDIHIRHIEGVITEGGKIYCHHNIVITNSKYTRESGISSFAFTAKNMNIYFKEPTKAPKEFDFGICNFMFGSTNNSETIDIKLEEQNFIIEKHPNYLDLGNSIRIHRNTSLTSIIRVINPIYDIGATELDIQHLCFLLSVATGTKISWIYFDALSDDGNCVYRIHYDQARKPYVNLPTLNTESILDLKDFINTTFYILKSRRKDFEIEYIISAWLDARPEHTYLQSRAINLVVMIEMALKEHRKRHPESRHLIENDLFNEKKSSLKKEFKKLLKSELGELPKEIMVEIVQKMNDWNRPSFGKTFEKLLNEIDLLIPPNEISLFVKSRNSLVHAGTFYAIAKYEEEKEKQKEPVPDEIPQSVTEESMKEFWFLLSVTDRILLKILGYKGTYVMRKDNHIGLLKDIP